MKHQIISSRSALVLCSFSISMFFGMSLILLRVLIYGGLQDKGEALWCFGASLGLVCILLFSLNRAACVVWVEDGIVKRRGLICGFYKECAVKDIKTVKIEYRSREVGFRTFIYLIDDRKQTYKKFLRARKDSYISFRKNDKNLAFLRTFWSGEVET